MAWLAAAQAGDCCNEQEAWDTSVMLREAMRDAEQAENATTKMTVYAQQLETTNRELAAELETLRDSYRKLNDELTELQLLAAKDGTVRFGPTGSEEAATPRRRGRGRR